MQPRIIHFYVFMSDTGYVRFRKGIIMLFYFQFSQAHRETPSIETSVKYLRSCRMNPVSVNVSQLLYKETSLRMFGQHGAGEKSTENS